MRCALLCLLPACFSLQHDINIVRGQVLYGDRPLHGALVRLIAQGSGDPTAAVSVLTAENGEYRFRDVASGDYGVFVTTDRWTAESNVSLVVHVDPAGSGVSHPVARDQTLPAIALTPAGAVDGELDASTVLNASLEGVVVTLEGTAFQARADAAGHFDFGRLPVGRYHATAVAASVIARAAVAFSVRAEAAVHVRIVLDPSAMAMQALNHAPVVGALTVAPVVAQTDALFDASRLAAGQLMRGTSVTLHCPASDPDGDVLVYSWQVSGGVSTQLDAATITWSAQAGAASIRCTVTDGQGAFATASTTLEVRDYRLLGAAFSDSRAVFAQGDLAIGTGAPDFDLIVYDIAEKTALRIAASGQQTQPHAFAETVVYVSDEVGTAQNPFDVYGRALPTGAATRLSSSDGSEVHDIGPAGIAVAHNDGPCTVELRSTLTAPPSPLYTSSVQCDRLVVGQNTLLVREASATAFNWKLVDVFTTLTTDAPMAWASDNGIVAVFNGTSYVAAVPSLGKVFRFPESFAGIVAVGDLPQLNGSVTASVASRGALFAWTAFDSGGLFGSVRGVSFELPTSAATTVHAAANGRLLLESEQTLHLADAP